jgi:VCBS repeat-containing protein/predicted outer membrane repeat protein
MHAMRRSFECSCAVRMLLALLMLWPLAEVVSANPRIIYVHADASGEGNGLSWEDAFTDLSSALSIAAPGDEIWVAAGIYTPGSTLTASFNLRSGIALYGGFAGTEIERDERDWTTHITILSGDIGRDDDVESGIVTDIEQINGDNSYTIVNGSFTDSTAILDGFVITGGWANAPGSTTTDIEHSGGGLYIDSGSPTLRHLVFCGNEAVGVGGAVHIRNQSAPHLTDVIFEGNKAGRAGGAIYITASNVDLVDAVFRHNRAETTGGGIHTTGVNNTLQLTGVLFEANVADQHGGGLYNYNGASLTMHDVTFVDNVATLDGGGVSEGSQNAILTSVEFRNNSAARGGGLYVSNPGELVLVNAVFSGNSANRGGGVLYELANALIVNSTFYGNVAYDEETGGAAIYTTKASTLANSILWGNQAPDGEQFSGSNLAVTYSVIQGGHAGEGNLDSDPLFVAAEAGDLRLGPGSPAIDAGSNDAVPAGIDTDRHGAPRFIDMPVSPDTGQGDAPIVDMGAYEAHLIDVGLSMSMSSSTASPGETLPIEITLSLSNNSLEAMDRVTIICTMPDWASIGEIRSEPSLDIEPVADQLHTWTVADLPPESDSEITLSDILDVPLTAGDYPFIASVLTEGDMNPANDTDSASLTVDDLAPVASDDEYSTRADQPLLVAVPGVLDNDHDPNGSPLTAAPLTAPARGVLVLNADGGFSYDPDGAFDHLGEGAQAFETFTYVAVDGVLTDKAGVTITILGVNDAPSFTGQPVTKATSQQPYSDTVTAHDIDEGDSLSIYATALPDWLTLTDHGDGTALLAGTPERNDSGTHQVRLVVEDDGGLCDVRTWTITVEGGPGAPRYRLLLPMVARNGR